MTDVNQVMTGISKFVDADIIPKLQSNQKILAGVMVGLALRKTNEIIDTLKDNSIISMLGLIEENKVDVDSLYQEIKKQVQKQSIVLSVPMIGNITLNESDIDKIYNYIIM